MDDKIANWKIAKVTKAMREIILHRDKECVLCWSIYMLDIHHVLFGTQTIYDSTRNTPVNLVAVCRKCHESIHWCRKWVGDREKVIIYLKQLYEQKENIKHASTK